MTAPVGATWTAVVVPPASVNVTTGPTLPVAESWPVKAADVAVATEPTSGAACWMATGVTVRL